MTHLKPLPPHLEELWEQLQTIQDHPGYAATLDTPFVEEDQIMVYHYTIQMPRSWLLHGREAAAREAAAVIDRLLTEFPLT